MLVEVLRDDAVAMALVGVGAQMLRHHQQQPHKK